MSDLMLTAVLSMPYDMAMENEFSRRQFWDRAQQALAEIERLTAEHTGQLAELEAISTALGTNEGNSSVDHILSLREAARTWENEAERRSRRFEQCAAERDELRRQLAEAAESIARQAATIRGLTRPAEE